jgi:uroporphyrinogen decarboxylase
MPHDKGDTMPETMTSKERVKTSLTWQEPDRVPIQLYAVGEIMEALRDHFATDDEGVRQALGVDFREINAPYAGTVKEPHDDIHYTPWGFGYRDVVYEHGKYGEIHIRPWADFTTVEEVETFNWPDPDDYDYSQIEAQCDRFADRAVCVGNACWPDINNMLGRGRGVEQAMVDIALRDPVGMACVEKICEITHEIAVRTLEAGNGKVDILCLGEDMGNQNGRMFSPKDFEDVFRPRLQRFIDLGHKYGCKTMMHSCGDTHDIQPTLIEMGLDILDAMQPEPRGMHPIEELRERTRGKLAYCGLISTQNTLPFKDETACRAEARHRLDVIARGGGYIFAPSHNIQFGTPLANVLAVYEEALGRTPG